VVERIGDRVAGRVGIAAPVFGAGGALLGALALTLPESRRRPGLTKTVRDSAAALSRTLGAPESA
jgi:DNA-binding IclR family transcriptional regulator